MMSSSCSCGSIVDALDSPTTTGVHLVDSIKSESISGGRNEYQNDVKEEEEDVCYEHYKDAMEREEERRALQLQVRSLHKYKSNYELLCGQLGELNTQIELQLQRHEADVAALQASIANLQTEKISLQTQLLEAQKALVVQQDAARQDYEYAEQVRRQLSTAAERLKATEKRLEQQKEHFTAELTQLQSQLVVKDEECADFHIVTKELGEELQAFRAREATAREQEITRKRHEKKEHKKQLMAHAAKLRAIENELETQRSALRVTKKHLAQVQADNDMMHKRLISVKRDGAHLSNVIGSQRAKHEAYVDELAQVKRAKKQLVKRAAMLCQESERLEKELSAAKRELLHRNKELKKYRNELESVRTKLRDTSQALDEVHCSNNKMMKKVAALQKVETERHIKAKEEEQERRACRERRYCKDLIRMRELLVNNQQHAVESSKEVHTLRHELLGVQKLLRDCNDESNFASEPRV